MALRDARWTCIVWLPTTPGGPIMDLRQLEIIRAIAEAGSFTGAGERLHVSQSAISRQILLLEDELNEAVFLRVGRRIRITPAGEALLQLSHRVFQDLKDTVALISDSRQALRGPVRLVGGMTVSLYVFPGLLREFQRLHPQSEIKIWAGATDRCIASIRAGTADLGLLTLPIDAPDLVTVPAIDEELLLVTSVNHPLARKKRIVAAGPAPPALHPVRERLEHAARARRVLPAREPRAADRDGDRERRDHQGAGAHQRRGLDRLVPVGSARVRERSAVLRAHRRAGAAASHGLGLRQGEPRAPRRAGGAGRVRAHPSQAQAVTRLPAPEEAAGNGSARAAHHRSRREEVGDGSLQRIQGGSRPRFFPRMPAMRSFYFPD